ncbi:ankyrin repeat-containing domain protein [Aspergillus pseudodeflectus]|uniref:Ankyrin repeat-containing domain protein n=1 Tax=Aspergillus pseudodeflectus TaxID=176178 RepID=A0ABR4K7Q8_9EURO
MSSILPPCIPPRPTAAQLLDLPKELFIRISRFLSTKSLLNFLLANREINQLCSLVLEAPTPESADLHRAIAWHATHDQEQKLMRILRNSQHMLMKHHESQFEALTYACAVGFENTVEWLIELGVNPDIRSSEPNRDTELKREGAISPLMAAALRNDSRFLAQFLKHLGKPRGYYLHEVMRLLFGFPDRIKDHDCAQLLVDAGLDHKIVDFDGTTTLHYAATQYSGEEVRFLKERGLQTNAQAAGAATPLAYAIDAGNIDTIQALLDLGAGANRQCTATTFPLFLAARSGNPAVVQLLLDHGANPNQIVPASGGTPFAQAAFARGEHAERSAIALLQGGASFSVDPPSTEHMLFGAISKGWTAFMREAFRALEARNEPLIAADIFFIAAAHLGDIRLMEALLATGTVNVDYLLPVGPGLHYGFSALAEACNFGGEDAFEWLIQRAGVTRFDFINHDGDNLYHRALRWPHPQRERTIRHLFDHLDPDELLTPNEWNKTPLEMAVGTQPYEIIHLMLSRIPPIGNRLLRRDDFSYPLSACLCAAARYGRLDVLQLLVHYMDSNQIALRPELAPLFTALQGRRHDVALWLIQQDITQETSVDNVRLLAAAAAVGFTDLVQILLQKGIPANSENPNDRSAFVAALMTGNLEAAQLLLDAGADTNVAIDGDPDFTERGKENLLLWAAARDHPATVQFLLERGWDVNGTHAALGVPPLAHAAANNAVHCMRLLIDAGADLEFADADGLTPLYHAAWANNPDVVQVLLDAGANPAPWDPTGNSPLIRAAARSIEITRMLVAAGVDVNQQSNKGSTALINAAARDQVESVRLLIERGADLEKRLHGRTALAWAVAENALGAAQLLVRAGADVVTVDEWGDTPLSLVQDEAALAILAEARRF